MPAGSGFALPKMCFARDASVTGAADTVMPACWSCGRADSPPLLMFEEGVCTEADAAISTARETREASCGSRRIAGWFFRCAAESASCASTEHYTPSAHVRLTKCATLPATIGRKKHHASADFFFSSRRRHTSYVPKGGKPFDAAALGW